MTLKTSVTEENLTNKSEIQYLNLLDKIVKEGYDIYNERTGVNCRTIINYDFVYTPDEMPLVTTRKSHWKAAIAEMLGYLRGYSSAKQFREIGAKTWDANANENEEWLNNPYRKGEDDIGRVYGVQGRDWTNQYGEKYDQLLKVYSDLKEHKDDRGEIIGFWNPGEFKYGALRPCMYEHQFSILGDTLYLNSTQRSMDVPLGGNFNMVQVYFLLVLMAKITNLKPGKAYHKVINAHIYENQLPYVKIQLEREPYPAPKFVINPDIKTLEDVLTWVTPDDFEVIDYKHHAAIKYPFTV